MANHLPIKYVAPPASPAPSPYATPLYPAAPLATASPQSARGGKSANSAAELGVTLIRALIGGAAALLGIVATLWLLGLAFALSATLAEALKLGLIAVAASASLAGLPVAAALLSRNYASEAAITMRGWATVVALAAVAAVYFTLTLSPPASTSAASALRSMPKAVWVHSDQCRQPENTYQEELCTQWRQGAAPAVSLLPFGAEAADNPLRRIMVAFLNIAALAGAGWLGRIYVLASAEAKTLETSEAQVIISSAAAAGSLPEMAETQLTPLEIFNMWYNGRVRTEASGRLPAKQAYEDYQAACAMNGYPSLSQQKFGQLLTSKAENSGGRVGKIKTGGNLFYTGVALTGDSEPIDIAAEPLGPVPSRS